MFFPNRKVQLLDISGVRAGGTAVITCPKGPRYKTIVLEFQDAGAGNTAAPGTAFAGEIDVILGSQKVRGVNATYLDLINSGQGAKYASIGVAGAANGGGVTRLPIFFEEPWRKRADYQNGLAVETGWLGKNDVFQVKVAIAAGVTTPVLSAYAIIDDYSSGKPNNIVKWESQDINCNGSTVQIANPFGGMPGGDLISELSFFDPSDSTAQSKTVTKARLVINGVAVHDDITIDQNNAALSFADMNAPLAGIYPIVMDHDDLFESLRQVGNIKSAQLLLTLKAASAGTLTRVTQRLGDPTAG